MKNVVRLLLFMMLCLFLSPQIYAETYVEKDNVRYTADGKTVVSGGEQSGTVKIAEGAVTIAKGAFYESGLKVLELPKSLKKIEAGAFENCTKPPHDQSVSRKSIYGRKRRRAVHKKQEKTFVCLLC